MGNVQQYIGQRVQVAQYNVEAVKYLGEGGSSYIFLVKNVLSGNLMVLKRLLGNTKQALEWIQAEMDIHKRLSDKSEQIVDFYASECLKKRGTEREVYILMEYCPNGHLYENMMRMEEKRFSQTELIRLFRSLCVPVQVLHDQDPAIAHRDLKLENFLLAKDKRYKLCDFGSCVIGVQSVLRKEDRLRECEHVEKRTTAMYRSPELADVDGTAMFGSGELTEAVDVWAMGCILYTLAFFKQPFPLEGLRTDRYQIPESSKYSVEVHKLIARMLTADVEKRATIDHVIDCCDALLAGKEMKPFTRDSAQESTKPKSSAKKLPEQSKPKDLLDFDFPATVPLPQSTTENFANFDAFSAN